MFMSSRNRLVLPVILATFAVLAGCSNNSVSATPPPSGSFSNSSLSGTYVFSAQGSDSSGVFFGLAGTLAANGSGGITGGTFDLNDPSVGVAPGTAISGGSYRITSDGRGTATLNTSLGTIGLDFVLLSSSHGLVTEYDNSASGSGSLDLQSTVAQSQIAGSYAFSLTGISSLNTTTGAQPSFATAGAFTLDANGNITSGVQDLNNNGNSAGVTGLSLSGSVSLASVPGVATLISSAGTFTYDVYPIGSTHLKFIEHDAAPILIGDAFTQTSSVASGSNVFALSGLDSVAGAPFTAAGTVITNGSGTVTAGSEDINDGGTASEVTSLGGSYTALSGGRSVLTLTGFNNGANGVLGSYQFAAFPSSGGLQLLEIDNQGITAGTAFAQSATSIASSQGYGLNLTGVNANGEEDDIAEFTNNNGTLTGAVDFNDMGNLNPNQKFSATYTADTTANGRGTIASSSFNLVSYVVDSTTTVFIETDNSQIAIGSFVLQTPTAKSNMAAEHLAALGLKSGAHKELKRH
jgi:hypothetical protein